MQIDHQISTKIKYARIQKTWTQRDLARVSGVSIPTIVKMESTGPTTVRDYLWEKVLDALDL